MELVHPLCYRLFIKVVKVYTCAIFCNLNLYHINLYQRISCDFLCWFLLFLCVILIFGCKKWESSIGNLTKFIAENKSQVFLRKKILPVTLLYYLKDTPFYRNYILFIFSLKYFEEKYLSRPLLCIINIRLFNKIKYEIYYF